MTPEILESYLSEYGWGFRKISGSHWVTGWQGRDRGYPLLVNLCETWICFHVKPLFRLSLSLEPSPELAQFILELNHSCRMVKLTIDDNGDLGLSLEIFTNQLTFSHFADALGIIGYYCDSLSEQLTEKLDFLGITLEHSVKYLA